MKLMAAALLASLALMSDVIAEVAIGVARLNPILIVSPHSGNAGSEHA